MPFKVLPIYVVFGKKMSLQTNFNWGQLWIKNTNIKELYIFTSKKHGQTGPYVQSNKEKRKGGEALKMNPSSVFSTNDESVKNENTFLFSFSLVLVQIQLVSLWRVLLEN
jgi:hypothetical protein